jgi:hypothetical protein
MASLDEIRKKLQEMESRKQGGNRQFTSGLTYPFWNIPENEAAVLRFLPDADPNNTFFWRERQLINLSFPGIKGQDEHKTVVVKVPCVEMWGDACPILAEIRPMWDDKSLEDTARKYWKKRSYMFQGFVNEDPLNEEESPENPIRRFILGPQIFNIVKDALLDPDMENVPTDYLNGTDFRITRTKKGQYADYSTSKWARKESSLTEEQLEAIEKFGLVNLNDWLPAKPDAAALNAISEMFEASINGELYDPEQWAKYYRPYGLEYDASDDNSSSETTEAKVEVKEEVKEEAAPAATPEPAPEVKASTGSSKSAQDILAKIKARSNAE